MAYIGQAPFQEFTSVPTKDNFTGDGSTTAFDLSAAVPVGSENALEVFVNNVRQEPGSGKAFTLGQDGNGDYKRITFASAPTDTHAIYVINDRTSFTSIAPLPQDLNGSELILDADADTTITADTDDQIDIKISGADDFRFTANTFTALAGSGVVIPDSGLTLGSTAVTSTAAELNLLDGVSGLVQADLTKLAAVDSTAAELNIMDGGTSATGTTLATADRVVVNDAGTMKQVALSDFETFMESNLDTLSSVTTVGALNAGSITSGFTSIDVGAGAITTTGLISGGSLDIDDVLINGSTIGHTDDSDLMTVADGILTVAGEVSLTTLDIGGTNVTATAAEINLIDGGTSRGTTAVASGDGILINDGGTMNMTNVDTVSTYFASHSVGGGNIVTTGALNSGTITSGFGTIDTGSSTITTTGAITGGSLTADDVAINGKVITMTGSAGDTFTTTVATNGATTLTTVDTAAAAANITITADGTAELAGTTVTLNSAGGVTLDADNGTITFADAGSSLGTITSSGYSGTAAAATTVTITDNESTDEGNVLVFVAGADSDGGTGLGLESDGHLTYNPSSGTLTCTNLVTSGTHTVTDSVTMTASNAVVFEGSTADAYETTLTTIDTTSSDKTISLPNVSGTLPVLAAVSTTQITSTPEELNLIDGGTARGTDAVASGDGILINDGGTMKMTNVDTVSTYFASHTVGGGNIVTTGALDTGSITSGFGAIDNGTSNIRSATITAETAFVPDASGGADLGTTSLEFNDLFLNDSGSIQFGDDQDTTLVHTDGTGLTLNSTNKLCFNDASQFIQGSSATVLSIGATDEIDLTATTVDLNGTLNVSGVATFQAVPVLPANSIDSAHYVDGSIDNAHIADDQIDSEHYADGSIDTAHIADLNVTGGKLALDHRSAGATDDVKTGNQNDYLFFDADVGISFFTANAEDMRLEDDGDLHVDNDVIAFSTTISDATLKYNINPVEFALDKIKQLKGVTFNYFKNDKESAGLLAQDVEKVLPSAVSEKKLPLHTGDDKAYKTLHYDSVTAILVEAIKELTAKVEKLENK